MYAFHFSRNILLTRLVCSDTTFLLGWKSISTNKADELTSLESCMNLETGNWSWGHNRQCVFWGGRRGSFRLIWEQQRVLMVNHSCATHWAHDGLAWLFFNIQLVNPSIHFLQGTQRSVDHTYFIVQQFKPFDIPPRSVIICLKNQICKQLYNKK